MTSHFSVPADWYRTFFTDPVVRFWDAAIPPAATQADIAFVRRHIAVSPPARIADVPCGTGRHAVALARMGFNVVAVDSSEPALQRGRAAAEALAVQFVRSDMLEWELEVPVDALICLGNSIGYFEPAQTQMLLRRFACALRTGGSLIVETGICAESLLPIMPERCFTFPGGSYEQEIAYDAFQSAINTRARLTLEGETHELRYRHFVMTSGELVRLMHLAGFAVSGLFGDTDDTPFAPGSARLLLVAVKT